MSAAFNLNVPLHLNRIGDGNFDAGCFRYVARWNEQENRVEFFLESLADQVCRFAAHSFRFETGELVRTGVSYKRTNEAFATLAGAAGWRIRRY